MTKLKTLKDFYKMTDHMEIDHYTLEELKNEAIKWIKDLKYKRSLLLPAKNKEKCEEYLNGGISILKKLFNITEEEIE